VAKYFLIQLSKDNYNGCVILQGVIRLWVSGMCFFWYYVAYSSSWRGQCRVTNFYVLAVLSVYF